MTFLSMLVKASNFKLALKWKQLFDNFVIIYRNFVLLRYFIAILFQFTCHFYEYEAQIYSANMLSFSSQICIGRLHQMSPFFRWHRKKYHSKDILHCKVSNVHLYHMGCYAFGNICSFCNCSKQNRQRQENYYGTYHGGFSAVHH